MAMTLDARHSALTSDEALGAGVSVVGGKAHGLARLSAGGMRVPPWFVLPASTFAEHLRSHGIDEVVAAHLAHLDGDVAGPEHIAAVSLQLRGLIEETELDPELRQDIEMMRATLGHGALAVRSSAVDEDGANRSFAGQLDSVLGVDDADHLMMAIRRCWSSAFGTRVLDYRRRNGSLRGACDIAVVVQRLVVGELSGVMFTADPITGHRERMRVSACSGLGEALVSGEVDGDEYLLDRSGCLLESRVARERAAPLLDAAALRTLAAAGVAIELAEGAPRDIEWTFADGDLWILQARPITSLPDRRATSETGSAAKEHRIVWDNSNIQESYCGVTTPLTFSFARAAYATVYEQTMRAVGVPERAVAEHRPMLRNLLGLIHGRVYYNLNNWYRGLLLLPAFQRNKADMERMMGVEEPVDFIAEDRANGLSRLRRLPSLVRTLIRLSARFLTLQRDTRRFMAHFESVMRSVDRDALRGRTLGELMSILDLLRRECLEQWTTPIINDFYVMMTVGRLRRLVERAAPDDVERVMQSLLGGADVAISAAPALLMLQMADAARAEPIALDALRHTEGDDALRRAAAASAAFRMAYSELVARFGDRCMGELKLESRALRDDPEFIVGVLRSYRSSNAQDRRGLIDQARHAREIVEQGVRRRVRGGFVGRWHMRRTLDAARRAIRARETMRLARTRLFGVHRDVYRAIGAKLCAAGRLETPDDVLYLTVDEIDAYWQGTSVSVDLGTGARARRREFAAYESIDAPNRIVTTGSPHESAAGSISVADPAHVTSVERHKLTSMMLRGLGCSPGIAEGRVRIVTGPSDDLSVAGHVLVATRTDPGWAPLFPSAAAIIVERGSVLSHSAVLARELGLPAVAAIPDVTRILRDGELVRVDGAAGTIERLETPCES